MTTYKRRNPVTFDQTDEDAAWLRAHIADLKRGVNRTYTRSTVMHALMRFYRTGVERQGVAFIRQVEQGIGWSDEKAPLIAPKQVSRAGARGKDAKASQR